MTVKMAVRVLELAIAMRGKSKMCEERGKLAIYRPQNWNV